MAVKVQHLRSTTASKRPVASALLDGEVALNTSAGTSGVFFKDANGSIIKVTLVGELAIQKIAAHSGVVGYPVNDMAPQMRRR